MAEAEQLAEILETLKAFRKEMDDFRQENKQEMAKMRLELKKEFDDEIQKVRGEAKTQGEMIVELQERVAEMEDWREAAGATVIAHEQQVKTLQAKLLDLQARSMRNNIRVFNCPESATDGKSVVKFLEEMFEAKLDLPEDFHFEIMRAHRSLGPRPGPNAPPRSIIANFLQWDTKELVLRKAWQADIEIDGKRVGFDHDYPPEIVKQRKAYIPSKKILKQNGIRFSSPFTKLRVDWPDGERTYSNAEDAAEAIRAKGLRSKDGEKTRPGTSDSSARDKGQTDQGGEGQPVQTEGATPVEGRGDAVERWARLLGSGQNRKSTLRPKGRQQQKAKV